MTHSLNNIRTINKMDVQVRKNEENKNRLLRVLRHRYIQLGGSRARTKNEQCENRIRSIVQVGEANAEP